MKSFSRSASAARHWYQPIAVSGFSSNLIYRPSSLTSPLTSRNQFSLQLPDQIMFSLSRIYCFLLVPHSRSKPDSCNKYEIRYTYCPYWFSPTDLCTIQLFDVNKRTFQGEWKHGTNDIVVEVKNKIGAGGFRECYSAEVKYLPAEFDFACSPSGWVAKFYKEKRAQEELTKLWSDCRKVSM